MQLHTAVHVGHLHRRCDHRAASVSTSSSSDTGHTVHSRSVTQKLQDLEVDTFIFRASPCFPTATDMHTFLGVLMIAGSTYISQGWGPRPSIEIFTGSSQRQLLAGPKGGGKQSTYYTCHTLTFEYLTVMVIVSDTIATAQSTIRGPTTGHPVRICKVQNPDTCIV